MWKALVSLVTLCALAVGVPAAAADLFQRNASLWKSQTKEIEGREFKFLVDPAKVSSNQSEAFKEIWTQAKAVGAKQGVTLREREKNAFNITPVVKTFFDTPDMTLWKKGYLIRTTTNYQRGYPASPLRVTVKAIAPSFKKALAAKLRVVNAKSKVSAEENIGLGKDGGLAGYVEKGVTFTAGRAELGAMNLAQFGAYVPELLALGLPADTKLVAYPAFGFRCRPGFIDLPGLERPLAVSMESWARRDNAAPFVYDFSFGYDGDYAALAQAHKAAEAFTLALYNNLNSKIGFPDAGRWNGSKARLLLNQGF